MQSKEIRPDLVIADQPSADELGALPAAGYAAVVNLRNDGEPEQPVGTAAEGEMVRGLGLDYLHFGVGGAPLRADDVSRFVAFLDKHEGEKVLVHCRKGGRAAALVLIREALAQGWPADEAVARGRELGLVVDGNLRLIVESYLRDTPNA